MEWIFLGLLFLIATAVVFGAEVAQAFVWLIGALVSIAFGLVLLGILAFAALVLSSI